MIFLKACPKCRGDIVLDRDMYGGYARCLQCGYLKDVTGKYEEVKDTPELARELEAA